jgi:predicted Rossmann-fold nucleotide-binding protein
MSVATTVTTLVKATPHLGVLGLNLVWIYFTLDSRVRKTRNAFEKQLVQQGMSKEDAKRLSSCFEDLKNDITATLKQGIASGIAARR